MTQATVRYIANGYYCVSMDAVSDLLTLIFTPPEVS